MFTGLVDDVGTIERVERTPAGRELRVSSRYAGLADGESVAVNGACLTVERAMRLGDRLGGHLVQGHVDDVGVVEEVRRRDDALLVDVRLPTDLEPLMVPHGSVAIDGVSLTVNALPAPGILQLSVIEYTWRHTTLGELRAGDRVHVEADMVGKYVRQLVAPYAAAR
jgi:riboflavin synthase